MPDGRRVTLVDVATLAGVSVTTASYVLNGRAEKMRISTDATTRVRDAAERLAYRPNQSARSLRTSTTRTIGVVSAQVASGEYASRMLSGAAGVARASDHLLVIGETEGDPRVEERVILDMLDRQVDGILYATHAASRVRVPERLSGVPTVLLNCVDEEGRFPAVLPDEVGGGRLAARTVTAGRSGLDVMVLGVDPEPAVVAGPLRMTGLRAELEESGNRLATVLPCEWDVRQAYDALSAWLREGHRPTALVCMNDRIAMGAYQSLAETGMSIPADVSVVSFDGSALATWLRPTLTSVALPFTELGSRAAELLIGRDTAGGQILVPMPLLDGASCSGARTSSGGVDADTRSRAV